MTPSSFRASEPLRSLHRAQAVQHPDPLEARLPAAVVELLAPLPAQSGDRLEVLVEGEHPEDRRDEEPWPVYDGAASPTGRARCGRDAAQAGRGSPPAGASPGCSTPW